MTDLHLALAHHAAIFLLVALYAVELGIVTGPVDGRAVRRLSGLDLWYGVLAGLVLAIGVVRVIYGAKGWVAYQHNPFFWAKMASFAMVGLLSVPPTIAFIRWRGEQRKDEAALPSSARVQSVRTWMAVEGAVFLLIPLFAAAMARYGG